MRLFWLVVPVIWTVPLEAQTVRGQLVDSISRSPLSGAFLTLVDQQGVERARAITNDAGEFVLVAPAAGTYHLRSKRIGFQPYVSPALTLASGATTTYRAAIDPIPLALKEIVVAGERQCDVEAGASVAALWGEVREALAAVAWSSRVPGYWYDLTHFERELSAGAKRIRPDSTWHEVGYSQAPFRSAPAAQLEAEGYVVVSEDGWTYYGPDAEVLLSTPFLRTHCFETKAENGLVGLAFTPARGRSLPDVKGTLWVDRENAELRYLEFSYTRLPERLTEPRAGGRVEFMRVPNGAWIIRDWVIRMPIARTVHVPYQEDSPRVVGFREAGGSAIEIKTQDGTLVYRSETAAAAAPPPPPAPAPAPALLAPPAVAPAPGAQQLDSLLAPHQGKVSRDFDQLRHEEFAKSMAVDAYSLVQEFRPNWLHSRGPASIYDPGAGEIKVYVDGFLMGGLNALHNVAKLDVDHLRRLSGPEATGRYGQGHAGGVIEVWTRRN